MFHHAIPINYLLTYSIDRRLNFPHFSRCVYILKPAEKQFRIHPARPREFIKVLQEQMAQLTSVQAHHISSPVIIEYLLNNNNMKSCGKWRGYARDLLHWTNIDSILAFLLSRDQSWLPTSLQPLDNGTAAVLLLYVGRHPTTMKNMWIIGMCGRKKKRDIVRGGKEHFPWFHLNSFAFEHSPELSQRE